MWPKVAVEEGRDTGMDRHRFPTEQQYPEQGKQTKDPLLDHENARVRMVSPAQIQTPCHSSHHIYNRQARPKKSGQRRSRMTDVYTINRLFYRILIA